MQDNTPIKKSNYNQQDMNDIAVLFRNFQQKINDYYEVGKTHLNTRKAEDAPAPRKNVIYVDETGHPHDDMARFNQRMNEIIAYLEGLINLASLTHKQRQHGVFLKYYLKLLENRLNAEEKIVYFSRVKTLEDIVAMQQRSLGMRVFFEVEPVLEDGLATYYFMEKGKITRNYILSDNYLLMKEIMASVIPPDEYNTYHEAPTYNKHFPLGEGLQNRLVFEKELKTLMGEIIITNENLSGKIIWYVRNFTLVLACCLAILSIISIVLALFLIACLTVAVMPVAVLTASSIISTLGLIIIAEITFSLIAIASMIVLLAPMYCFVPAFISVIFEGRQNRSVHDFFDFSANDEDAELSLPCGTNLNYQLGFFSCAGGIIDDTSTIGLGEVIEQTRRQNLTKSANN